MARLNITIPDELYASLAPWRDHINISKVCQEALTRELAKLNDLPRQAAELSDLIDRLHLEKANAEKFAFAQGLTDSVTWTRGASYAELRRWGELGEAGAARADDNAAFEAALQRHRDEPAFDERAYREGWMMGIKEVWQRVRDKV
jgi:post-segregation antitoxin (ccd killing protein)